ncbi:MAG TPA: DNA repair protein RecN [Magnetospirillaceae bacterium]|jgi:DNA repair protein RecN (Recombination protein N)
MLHGLSIRDVVLIDRLDIAFAPGLTVLTGETGAGKSILLDSMSLALGARADAGMVRPGAQQLSVTAEFALTAKHPALAILSDQGIEAGETLILRRVVGADGRSRAFVNDEPASVGLLRRLGEALVEIHGQFESHTLLDPDTHRAVLDAFAGADSVAVNAAWTQWRTAADARAAAEADLKSARGEEDYLRHAVGELDALAAKPGEEAALATKRVTLMAGEKLAEAMEAARQSLSRPADVEAAIRSAQRSLERMADKAGGRLDGVIAALDRAALEAAEARGLLENVAAALDLDPAHLEKAEERLFALRALARKHNASVDELPAIRERLSAKLNAVDAGGDSLKSLSTAEAKAKTAFSTAAAALSKARNAAAAKLDKAVATELPPLKLDKARFVTRVEALPEAEWNTNGMDRIAFEVATNPGSQPGPLAKVASGGELARFMLALKVVLARTSPIGTIVFDEVDADVGGATAAAVGERLARLSKSMQVLVVTHSPQVAAKGAHHWQVAKGDDGKGGTATRVIALVAAGRREEIARMLAGAKVTDQARAAADSLLAAAG